MQSHLTSISLKRHCSQRKLHAIVPSNDDRVYTEKALTESSLVSKLIKSSQLSRMSNGNFKEMSALVKKIEEVFQKQDLDYYNLKEQFIRDLVALYTWNHTDEELNLIKHELNACHKRIKQGHTEERLLDALALTLDRYRKISKQRQNCDYALNAKMIVDDTTNDTATLEKCLEEAKSGRTIISDASFQDADVYQMKESIQSCAQRSFKLQYKEMYEKGHIISWSSRVYLLFVSLKLKTDSFKTQLEALDLTSGKFVKMTSLNGRDYRDVSIIHLFRKLNLLVINTYDRMTIEIYKISSKGLKLASRTKMTGISPFHREYSRLIIEKIESHDLLAFAIKSTIKLMNIISRKVVFSIESAKNGVIVDVKFMKKLNYLVVAFNIGKITVYEVTNSSCMLSPKYKLKLDGLVLYDYIGLSVINNSIIVEQAYSWVHRFQLLWYGVKYEKSQLENSQMGIINSGGISVSEKRITLTYAYIGLNSDPVHVTGRRIWYPTIDKLDEDEVVEGSDCLLIYEDDFRRIEYNTKTQTITMTDCRFKSLP